MRNLATLSVFFLGAVSFVFAKISTPAIFGSNMVLQRDHACPVLGWADPNSSVSLTFAGKTYDAKADQSGNWRITLSPLDVSSDPKNMIISYGKNLTDTLVYKNILVGEVWLCSGQSNMQWAINRSDDADLEALSANHPNLRLISVPQVGTQIPPQEKRHRAQGGPPMGLQHLQPLPDFFILLQQLFISRQTRL